MTSTVPQGAIVSECIRVAGICRPSVSVVHSARFEFIFDLSLFSYLQQEARSMDPVTLATVTSAVAVLASEAGKGLAGEAAKDLWAQIRKRLGLAAEPPKEELAPTVANALSADPDAAADVVRLLQQHAGQAGDAASLVGRIDAEKVIYIANQTVFGGQTFNL